MSFGLENRSLWSRLTRSVSTDNFLLQNFNESAQTINFKSDSRRKSKSEQIRKQIVRNEVTNKKLEKDQLISKQKQ